MSYNYENECKYFKICKKLNENEKGLICIDFIENKILDSSWKKRSVTNIEQEQNDLCHIKTNIHFLLKEDFPKCFNKACIYVPVIKSKKPLLMNFSITVKGQLETPLILKNNINNIIISKILCNEYRSTIDNLDNIIESHKKEPSNNIDNKESLINLLEISYKNKKESSKKTEKISTEKLENIYNFVSLKKNNSEKIDDPEIFDSQKTQKNTESTENLYSAVDEFIDSPENLKNSEFDEFIDSPENLYSTVDEFIDSPEQSEKLLDEKFFYKLLCSCYVKKKNSLYLKKLKSDFSKDYKLIKKFFSYIGNFYNKKLFYLTCYRFYNNSIETNFDEKNIKENIDSIYSFLCNKASEYSLKKECTNDSIFNTKFINKVRQFINKITEFINKIINSKFINKIINSKFINKIERYKKYRTLVRGFKVSTNFLKKSQKLLHKIQRDSKIINKNFNFNFNFDFDSIELSNIIDYYNSLETIKKELKKYYKLLDNTRLLLKKKYVDNVFFNPILAFKNELLNFNYADINNTVTSIKSCNRHLELVNIFLNCEDNFTLGNPHNEEEDINEGIYFYNVLRMLTNEYFYLTVLLNKSNLESTIKLDFTNKVELNSYFLDSISLSGNKNYVYNISGNSALSNHFYIESKDVGYNIKIKNACELTKKTTKFFENKSLIHGKIELHNDSNRTKCTKISSDDENNLKLKVSYQNSKSNGLIFIIANLVSLINIFALLFSPYNSNNINFDFVLFQTTLSVFSFYFSEKWNVLQNFKSKMKFSMAIYLFFSYIIFLVNILLNKVLILPNFITNLWTSISTIFNKIV